MKHAIVEFSLMYGFGHSAPSSSVEGDLCYEINFRNFDFGQIYDAIQILGIRYQEHFYEIVSEAMQKKIFSSKLRFMCFVLSRCMKLSETPTLFNFLVVCTFIDNIIFNLSIDAECFKVRKVAAKCLILAFYRRYANLFDRENGFKGFSDYCEKVNLTVLNPCEYSEVDNDGSLHVDGFIPPDTDVLITLIKSLKEIDDEAEFPLRDIEKKMLYALNELPLHIDPAKDILIPLPHDSEMAKTKDLDMQNLNIKSERVLKRLNDICLICKDNCYKFVVLATQELKMREI